MQTCTVNGDMSADRASEQYPTVNLCDACVAADRSQENNSQIVSTGDYDADFGEACEWCGLEADDEARG